ncbi:MAG: universal stress protein [Geminicoccaceae bacterium]
MFKKILLTIDHTDSRTWEKALPAALEEAKQHGAALRVISVIPEIIRLPNLPENYGAGAIQHVEGKLREILKETSGEVPIAVHQGSVYREILKDAFAQDIDLIIMASPRSTGPDDLLGPNVARVVRHAKCSVLVVRD